MKVTSGASGRRVDVAAIEGQIVRSIDLLPARAQLWRATALQRDALVAPMASTNAVFTGRLRRLLMATEGIDGHGNVTLCLADGRTRHTDGSETNLKRRTFEDWNAVQIDHSAFMVTKNR